LNDDYKATDELVEASNEKEDIVELLICSAATSGTSKIMSYLGTSSLISSSQNFSFSGYAGNYTGLRWETGPLKVFYFSGT
jgi:hypothetical protein